MRVAWVAVGASVLVGCGGPSAPPPSPPSSPPSEPSASAAPSSPPAPPAPEASPSVPPRPVEGKDAFFIISVPSPVTATSAKICATSPACDALLPPNPPTIVRRFDQEAWVVVATPARMNVTSVKTDGASAEAVLEAACPPAGEKASEDRLVLYRVAKTVTKATFRVAGAGTCPPAE